CAGATTLTPDVRVVHVMRIFCLSELGRYAEAQEALRTAERWLQDHPNDRVRLILLLNQSQLASTMDRHGEVIDIADKAAALAAQLNDPARKARALINRANAHFRRGEYDRATTLLAHVIDESAGIDQLTRGRAYLNRAILLCAQAHLFDAFTTLRQAEPMLLE